MRDKYYMSAYWKQRKLTLCEYVVASRRYLENLQRLHPAFAELAALGSNEDAAVWLNTDLSNLEELILRRSYDSESIYALVKPDGSPTLESYSEVGFSMSYSNTRPVGEDNLHVYISAGKYSPWLINNTTIDFPRVGYDVFGTYDFVKRILEIAVECWHPSTALITSDVFRDATKNDKWSIGWVTYFADPKIRSSLPKNVEQEPLGDGVLVTTTHDLLLASNPSHIEAARRIRDSLQPRGFLRYQRS